MFKHHALAEGGSRREKTAKYRAIIHRSRPLRSTVPQKHLQHEKSKCYLVPLARPLIIGAPIRKPLERRDSGLYAFGRSMDHLEINWGGRAATDTPTAGDLEEHRWLSNDPHWLHDTHVNNNHDWASLAPEMCSATATPSQAFPTHEWTDVMPPGLVNANNSSVQHPPYSSIQHPRHMAPAPGFPAAGPNPMAGVHPVWATAGSTPAMAPGGGAFAHMGARPAAGHPHNGWHAWAHHAATNPSLAQHGAGAAWQHSSRPAVAASERTPAPNAEELLGEEVIYRAAEQDIRGTSSSSASDASGPEGDNDGAAERNTAGCRWWVGAASSNYTGDALDG